MFKKLISIVVVLMMMLSLATGCSNQASVAEKGTTTPESEVKEEPKEEPKKEEKANDGILVWNMGVDPETWDPTLNAATDGGHVINNVFDGLTRESKSNGIEPAQAEKWDISDDGKTYTFHLRKGLKWSDGKELTAKDFEYSWKRAADPKVGSEYATMVTQYIVGAEEYFMGTGTREEMAVKAVDDLTLEVKLKFPVPYFLSLTSFYTYAPVREDIVTAKGEGWEKDPAACISNGPFKVTEYQPGSHIMMVKNENYWDAANIKLKGIKALMIEDGNTKLNGYEAGEIAVLDGISADRIPELLKEDPYFHLIPQVGTYYVNFNVDDPVMKNPNIRKALALAIDRKKFVEQVTKAGQIPATGFIPNSLTYSDGKSCRDMSSDGIPVPQFGIEPRKGLVEEAKKLMADAGFKDGKGFPSVTFLYNTGDNNKKIAEALQAMWKENLGIDVQLKNEDWAVFLNTRRDGNYQIARGGWIGDYADPMTMLELFASSSGNNDPQWRFREEPATAPHDKTLNPEEKAFEDALLQARLTSGTDRDNWLKKAEQVMMDNMIVAPIYYYTMTVLINESIVEGVEITPTTKWDFRNAYLVE